MAFPYNNDDFYEPHMTIPDMIRRGVGVARPTLTVQDLQTQGEENGDTAFTALMTSPGGRPEVYLRGLNFAVTANVTPVAITANRNSVDTIIVDVPSTAANSAFFGFGSGISTANGLEVRTGTPLIFQPDNTRELWEIQRQLEYISMLMAAYLGVSTLPTYRAPRVVLDPSQYFLTAAAATIVNIMLIYVPEQQ